MLLYKFNNIDGWNILTILSGIAAFFIASLAENEMKSISDLYKVFPNLFSEGIAWMALLFIVGLISVGELAHRAGKNLIYNESNLKSSISESTRSEKGNSTNHRSINDTQGSLSSPLHEDKNGDFPINR